jgi:hypothetical protein
MQPLSYPPSKQPITGPTGALSPIWTQWLQVLWKRVPRHGRITTGAVPANSRAIVTVAWTPAFEDANYSVAVAVEDFSATGLGLRYERILAKNLGNVQVQVINDSASSLTGTLNATAVHD